MAFSSTRRPNNAAILAAFVVMSCMGLWFMRIYPSINEFPVGLFDMLDSGVLHNGRPLKKHYTGIGMVDEVLSLLVAVFIYGPAGWNNVFFWQEVHFLIQISAVIAVMSVEACRGRNSGSWAK